MREVWHEEGLLEVREIDIFLDMMKRVRADVFQRDPGIGREIVVSVRGDGFDILKFLFDKKTGRLTGVR